MSTRDFFQVVHLPVRSSATTSATVVNQDHNPGGWPHPGTLPQPVSGSAHTAALQQLRCQDMGVEMDANAWGQGGFDGGGACTAATVSMRL